MSDIQPGDVVVCVDARPSRVVAHVLVLGRTYRVLGIIDGFPDGYLGFVIYPEDFEVQHCWDERRFRKIEAPRTEISDRIRKCRPVTVPA